MSALAADRRLTSLLEQWQARLKDWASSGELTSAAQAALLLDGEPQALTELMAQWSSGNFQAIPTVDVLTAVEMNGAMGAYAAKTRQIYLNSDWLQDANSDQVIAVLTEELAHHLDTLLNATDTPGDEGQFMANRLLNQHPSSDQQSQLRRDDDRLMITLASGELLEAEAAALASVTGPTITSASLSANSIDLSNPAARQIALNLGVIDPYSPLTYGSVSFRSPSGKQRKYFSLYNRGLLSGSLQQGIFTSSFRLDAYSEPGLWKIEYISLYDNQGNSCFITPDINTELAGLASLSFLVVNPTPDTAAPRITSASLSVASVDLTNLAASQIGLNLGFNDDLSGFNYGTVSFRSPSGRKRTYFSVEPYDLRSGSLQNGILSSSVSLDELSEPGFWSIDSIYLTDNAGNVRSIYSDFNSELPGLASLGFQVINSNDDSTAPLLTSASFNAASVDLSNPAGRQLGLSLGFTDDSSGLQSISLTFRSPSGANSTGLYLSSSQLRSGNLQNGVVSGSFVLDSNVEAGLWSLSSVYIQDKVGHSNYSYYDFDSFFPGLASLGFQVLNPVSINPVPPPDSTAPQLTGITLNASVFDLSQFDSDPVVLTITAADDLSGFSRGSFNFVSPTGLQSLSFTTNNFLSGSSLAGSYFGNNQLTPYAEAGTWKLGNLYLTDKNGNYIEASDYYGNLDSLFPNLSNLSFQVINPRSDRLAPVLNRAVLNSDVIDLSQPGAGNVGLTIDITDDWSGFDLSYFRFSSPSRTSTIGLNATNLLAGSSLGGTFYGATQLSPYAEAGTWTLDSVYLSDKAANSINVNSSDGSLSTLLPSLSHLSFQVLNSRSDTVAPTLQRAALNTNVINLCQPGSGNVGLTIAVSDDWSGYKSGYFEFISPSGQQAIDLFCDRFQSGSLIDGLFYGSNQLYPDSEVGTWTLSYASLRDEAFNEVVGESSLENLDVLLPGLSSLSFEVVNSESLLPVVYVAVASSSVVENESFNLIYTFTRTGSTASGLDVYYSITGSADGSDYSGAIPGANKIITFLPGSSTATLTIDPNADSTFESDETVVLTLQSGIGYKFDSSASATATILNDDVAPPTYTTLSTVGSVVFQKATLTNRYSVAVDGVINPITIQGNPIYEGIYPDWETLSAATINGTNTVLWHNRFYDRLHTWTTDSNWSWLSSQGWIDPNSNDGYTLESQFHQDFNHDTIIGAPYIPITTVGSVVFQKAVDTNRYSVAVDGVINPITIQGNPIYQGIYPDWETLSAATINGTNTVLWHNTLHDRLHTWTTDSNWSWLSSQGWIDPNSSDGYTLESQFQQDFNHDTIIGAPSIPITTVGSVVFQKAVDTNRYSVAVDGVINPITIQGNPIYQGIYPDWETLSAATINGTNTVLWHNTLYDRLHTWTTDSNWSWLSSQGWIDPNSSDGYTLESQFQQDFNHDTIIGAPSIPITTVGSVVFQKAADTNRYSVAVDGVIKPITIHGNPIYEGIYPDWETLSAATINGTNTVLWHNTLYDRLHTWTTDSNWSWLFSHGWIDPNSNDGYTLESQFQQDFNHDTIIGAPYTPITTVGSVVFQKAALTNRYSVAVDGVINPITIQGNPIYEGIYPDWATLAAATINGTNTVLWHNTLYDRLHTWTTDSNWSWLS